MMNYWRGMETCSRRCAMREPFEVDESYDVAHAEDIITGRLAKYYAERV